MRILAISTIILSQIACSKLDPCGNDILQEVQSPNKQSRVVIFQRSCGATTGYSTQVSVLFQKEAFYTESTWFKSTSQANCFTCDSDGKAAPGPGGGPVVKARWLSEQNVEIEYDELARTFLKNTKVGNVEVTYKPAHYPRDMLKDKW